MPRASRILKGNKRRGTFDRLIVPKNGYKVPDPIRELPPDLPTEPVGQRVRIVNVVIYEVSISYEGKPQKFVKRIPFGDIVGSPISNEAIQRGYAFETPQGETILVKWHLATNRADQGLILHNVKARGTSWYEPNWGQVYGVGLEWRTCDGTMSGTVWANRHIGNTSSKGSLEAGDFELNVNLFPSSAPPDYSPNAIRPGLMLGNPEPERTLWLMGQELPMRVYPALGQIGKGCVFGFNKNVMEWVYVKPPTPPYIKEDDIGTVRGGDYIAIRWQRDDFTASTYVACKFNYGAEMVTFFAGNPLPTNGKLIRLSSDTASQSGSFSMTWRWAYTAGDVEIVFMLMESGTDRIIACQKVYLSFGPGTGPALVIRSNDCEVSPVLDECGNETDIPPIIEDPVPTPPAAEDLLYFCNLSIPPSSIDTTYWDSSLQQYGIRPEFWDGRNDIINLFASIDTTIDWRKSLITPGPFHYYLFKMLSDIKSGNGAIMDNADWQFFRTWCAQNGLDCLTDLQKATLFCSYWLGVPVNFFSNASGYLQGDVLTVLTRIMSLLPRGIYDWIDFNDVVTDTGGSVTGAFAADFPEAGLSGFRSYLNFEPQALLYSIDSAIAHRPVDYIKLPGSTWGTVTQVDWSQYNIPEMTDLNYKPYVVGEIGVHEIGHAVSFYGLDKYGQILHERPDWLEISGWASKDDTHLSKSRSADQTGGMPLTDNNKEAPVSDYGCFSPAEDFAEAYRMYVINPVFMEAKYPQKYLFMVNVVEPMFLEG